MIKISYNNVVKKVTLTTQTLDDLITKILLNFPELKGVEMKLFYLDDGDKIDVSDDADVENMLADNLPVYKLFIEAGKIEVFPTITVPLTAELHPTTSTKNNNEPIIEEISMDVKAYPQMLIPSKKIKSTKKTKEKKLKLTEDQKKIIDCAKKILKGNVVVPSHEMNMFANYLIENPECFKESQSKYLKILSAKALILGLTEIEELKLNDLKKMSKAHRDLIKTAPVAEKSGNTQIEAQKTTPSGPLNPQVEPLSTNSVNDPANKPKVDRKEKKVHFDPSVDDTGIVGSLMKWYRGKGKSVPLEQAIKIEELLLSNPQAFQEKPRLRRAFLSYKKSIYGLTDEESKELELIKEDSHKKKLKPKHQPGFYICDGCEANPIVGNRYRSKVLPNFDFCQKCFDTTVNKEEFTLFPAFSEKVKTKKGGCSRGKRRGLKHHMNYICDGCKISPIVGRRYHSNVLKNFDYCEKCFSSAVNKEEFTCILPQATNQDVDFSDPNTISIDIDPSNFEAGLKFVEEILGGGKQEPKQGTPLNDEFLKNGDISQTFQTLFGLNNELFKGGDLMKTFQSLLGSLMNPCEAYSTTTPIPAKISKPKKKLDASLLNGEFLSEVSTFPAKPTPSDKNIYKTYIVKNTGNVGWNDECFLGVTDAWMKLQKVRLPNLKPGEQGVVTVVIPNLGFPVFEISLGFKHNGAIFGTQQKVKISQ